MEYVKNGEIVLNISPDAAHRLTIGNDAIQFAARFSRRVARVLDSGGGGAGNFRARKTARACFSRRSRRPRRPSEATPTPPAPGGKPKLQIVK